MVFALGGDSPTDTSSGRGSEREIRVTHPWNARLSRSRPRIGVDLAAVIVSRKWHWHTVIEEPGLGVCSGHDHDAFVPNDTPTLARTSGPDTGGPRPDTGGPKPDTSGRQRAVQTTTRATCRKVRGSMPKYRVGVLLNRPNLSRPEPGDERGCLRVLLGRVGARRGDEPGEDQAAKTDECDCDHFLAPSAEPAGFASLSLTGSLCRESAQISSALVDHW
jgi:hypothetical protein